MGDLCSHPRCQSQAHGMANAKAGAACQSSAHLATGTMRQPFLLHDIIELDLLQTSVNQQKLCCCCCSIKTGATPKMKACKFTQDCFSSLLLSALSPSNPCKNLHLSSAALWSSMKRHAMTHDFCYAREHQAGHFTCSWPTTA